LGTLMKAQQVADGPLHGTRSREWVLDQARAGKLPHIRLGARTILFDIEDVERWIASGAVPARESA
jgi:hypothetical protein